MLLDGLRRQLERDGSDPQVDPLTHPRWLLRLQGVCVRASLQHLRDACLHAHQSLSREPFLLGCVDHLVVMADSHRSTLYSILSQP